MKIYSYNVNGLRAAMKKGLLDWIKQTRPDILCIQESKAQKDQVDMSPFHALGYKDYWHSAEKKGYSGVLTLSKIEVIQFQNGMGIDKYDREGRVLITKFRGFSLVNCYFPSGSSGEERHSFKMDFLGDFKPWIKEKLKKSPNLVVLGDYNVVRLDYDIHNPSRRDNPSGFRPEERFWLNEFFEEDFSDALRQKNPDQKDIFSWWSYRAGSRQKNKGWRIDYIGLSKNIKGLLTDSDHDLEAMHSDHCPIWVELQDEKL